MEKIDLGPAIDPLPLRGEFCTLYFSETTLYKKQNVHMLVLWRLGRLRVLAMLQTLPLKLLKYFDVNT